MLLGNTISSYNKPINALEFESNHSSPLRIATFNLFNYLEPPNAFYEFERIYSAKQWQKKQRWISDYLATNQPDIIGFQEVFSTDSLKQLLHEQGYHYFAVVDQPEIIDDFIYKSPVVAVASRYPIIEVIAPQTNSALAQQLGLTNQFSYSRAVLRATINIPHLGYSDCYVVHFKSKRPTLEFDAPKHQLSPEKTIIESLKAQIAGSWASTIQRGSEATLLLTHIIERRAELGYPVILMGDFNNTLDDGVLTHMLTQKLRFVSSFDSDSYLAKYCLYDSWQLFQKAQHNESMQTNQSDDISAGSKISDIDNIDTKKHNCFSDKNALNEQTPHRTATHYYGGKESVLDYILLSCEFDASYHDSLFQVTDYQTFDKHLINPSFDIDGESTDHAIPLITLTLRS